MACQEIIRTVQPPGRDGDGARSEMARAGDVIRSIADDDKLRRAKVKIEMAIDALGGEGRKITAIMRIIAERARQLKEGRQIDEAQFQVRDGLDIAGQQA